MNAKGKGLNPVTIAQILAANSARGETDVDLSQLEES